MRRLIAIVAFAVAVVAAGCGSALKTNAEAATLAFAALGSARAVALEVEQSEANACGTDHTCIDRIEHDFDAVSIAHDSARVALISWSESIRLAHIASADNTALWQALLAAAGTFLHEWTTMAEALRPYVTLPELPPILLQLVPTRPQ